MMNNKDLIEKIMEGLNMDGLLSRNKEDKKLARQIITNNLSHLEATTESKEADGEWIEKKLKDIYADLDAQAEPVAPISIKYILPIEAKLIVKMHLSNLPKTNDKIDEIYKKWENCLPDWEGENYVEQFLADLTNIKSPTVPKDGEKHSKDCTNKMGYCYGCGCKLD